MHFSSIINTASGSVPNDAADRLKSLVEKHGHTIELECVDGSSLPNACDQIKARSSDGIIAWGGDGTLACALDCAAELDVPLLALPGGTMNLLTQRIHGEASDWVSALNRAFEREEVVTIPAAQFEGRTFYVGLLVGHLTELAKSREHLRSGEIIPAMREAVQSGALDLETALRLRFGLEEISATAAGVFVPETGDKELDIVTIDPDGIWDLVETGLNALVGKWYEAPGVALKKADSLTIMSRQNDIPATMDGEPVILTSGVRIDFLPDAVKVWTGAQT